MARSARRKEGAPHPRGPIAAARAAYVGAVPATRPVSSPWENGLAGALLIALPFAFLALNSEWMFSPPGTIDPWIYTGFFVNLKQLFPLFGSTYYAGRLPWILPGALTHALFGPLIANYVLHLTFYALAVGSLYTGLKEVLGARVALFATLLMGGYSHFLGAIGWDYVDGAGITFFLATFALLTCAATRVAWRGLLIASGAAFALLVYCNMFWIAFAPLLAVHFHVVHSLQRRRPLRAVLWHVAIGFVVITVLFVAISWRLGGPPVFFFGSLRSGGALIVRPNQWAVSMSTWVPRAGWLVFPLAILVASSVRVASGARRLRAIERADVLPLLLPFEYVAACILMVAVEVAGIPVLQLTYYASYLIPLAFIALASLLAPTLAQLSRRAFGGLAVITTCLLLAPFAVEAEMPAARLSASAAAVLAAALGVGSLVNWIPTRRRSHGLALVLLAAAFSVVSHATALAMQFGFVHREGSTMLLDLKRDNGISNKTTYLTVLKTVRTMQDANLSYIPIFWYDTDSEFGGVQCSAVSTYLWGFRLVNDKLPHLGKEDIAKVTAHRIVAVMSADEAVIGRAYRLLLETGLRMTRLPDIPIEEGPVRFKVALFRMDYPGAPAANS